MTGKIPIWVGFPRWECLWAAHFFQSTQLGHDFMEEHEQQQCLQSPGCWILALSLEDPRPQGRSCPSRWRTVRISYLWHRATNRQKGRADLALFQRRIALRCLNALIFSHYLPERSGLRSKFHLLPNASAVVNGVPRWHSRMFRVSQRCPCSSVDKACIFFSQL